MDRAVVDLRAVAPALAFLCASVPFAALLGRLGFFAAVTDRLSRRGTIELSHLWVLAAVTTVVLSLDTTVVLLAPLSVHLARRAGTAVLPVAVVPLLLAGLASSVLPVSNLTTLIVVDRVGLPVGEVAGHLALPSLAAVMVGWAVQRRLGPRTLILGPGAAPERGALSLGGIIVGLVLVGFVAGPRWGVAPWMVLVVADIALVAVTRFFPWQRVPLVTATVVAVLVLVVSQAEPAGLLAGVLDADPLVAGLAAAGVANVINNLPAVLVALSVISEGSWGLWAWVLGINAGAVLLPIGALANVLWWRILRDEQVPLSLSAYVRHTAPVALPALAAALLVLRAEQLVVG